MTGRYPAADTHAGGPNTGRLRRWAPVLAAAAGLALLVYLYWPVILTGLAGFVVVWRLLRVRVPHRRRGRFLRETAPRWIEAVGIFRAGGRIGR